ncbi:NUDIX hydrolase [Nocardioides sp. CFH 31398]|uniref:NUDIX hydrolase n=1 Tax=Nocardioides sp. CFH 31398 TaxID=2919579 RepID=UPI001F06518A|nr:NUDIX domain-containing protein [Nocardioides sp. CFH 31398]MCH1868948.1 NUDIX domain-containing protein [Nocardioides sp. CFH 31398]
MTTPGADGSARIRRTTARVLPVSDDGAVLLVQDHDPAHPDALRWGSVGGGVDPGESPERAAVRELHEETGVVAVPAQLIGPVHAQEAEYSFAGLAYRAASTYWALHLERGVPTSLDHLAPDEVGHVFALDWWTPEQLEAPEAPAYADDHLPEIMRAAVVAVLGGGTRDAHDHEKDIR